jgi:hypothetical protein
VLAKWTVDVYAPGLALPPSVFDDPSVFESEPSSDSGDSTPYIFYLVPPYLYADD